jgi:acyl-CoA thioester hydrolase
MQNNSDYLSLKKGSFMPEIFMHNIKVDIKAIDEIDHVNNVVYVQWMQDIAILHSIAQGLSQEAYLTAGAGWVAKSHFIQYRSPAFLNDEIIVYTWVSKMSALSSLRKYKFIRKTDSKVIVEAETDWVFVNIKTGRPLRISEAVKKSFQIVPADQEP